MKCSDLRCSVWIQVLVKDSVPGDSIIWRLKNGEERLSTGRLHYLEVEK